MNRNDKKTYVLITPAKNEERYIKKTINSVLSQTLLPKRWVIVSDCSTDGTDEIVSNYSKKNDFIKHVRTDYKRTRNYGSKVMAFKTGVESLNNIEYDFIGNLDADVSFDSYYFESLIKKFTKNKKLGLGGGIILELKRGIYKAPFGSKPRSVPGAIQLFRKECYENIGGFFPLPLGGEDGVAEMMARINKWKVESFSDLKVIHHRSMGFETNYGILKYRFKGGLRDYSMGYSPIYFLLKAFTRITEEPYIIGTLFRLSGFCWAVARRYKKEVPNEIIDSIRKEQINRLKSLLHSK